VCGLAGCSADTQLLCPGDGERQARTLARRKLVDLFAFFFFFNQITPASKGWVTVTQLQPVVLKLPESHHLAKEQCTSEPVHRS